MGLFLFFIFFLGFHQSQQFCYLMYLLLMYNINVFFLFRHHLFTEDLQRRKALKYLLSFTQSRRKKKQNTFTQIIKQDTFDVWIVSQVSPPGYLRPAHTSCCLDKNLNIFKYISI